MADLSRPEAAETGWFAELLDGSGAAAGLDPGLRRALQTVVENTAGDEAIIKRENDHRERAAAEQSARSKRAAEEATVEAARVQAQGERQAVGVAIVYASFRLLWTRTWISAAAVGITPMGASFATVIPPLAGIRPIIFFGTEDGSTAAGAPTTLYILLAITVGICILAAFTSDLVFGPRVRARGNLPIWAGLLGLGLFIVEWVTNSLAPASWAILPALVTVTYICTDVAWGARRRLARGDRATVEEIRSR